MLIHSLNNTKFKCKTLIKFSLNFQIAEGRKKPKQSDSGVGFLMNLRKAANHPLLVRKLYDTEKIRHLARTLKKHCPNHKEAVEAFIREDLTVLSDFHIHKTCLAYKVSLHL